MAVNFIKHQELREELLKVLVHKTRNQVVTEIKSKGNKFHQFNIDKFLSGEDIKLSTMLKIQEYLNRI